MASEARAAADAAPGVARRGRRRSLGPARVAGTGSLLAPAAALASPLAAAAATEPQWRRWPHGAAWPPGSDPPATATGMEPGPLSVHRRELSGLPVRLPVVPSRSIEPAMGPGAPLFNTGTIRGDIVPERHRCRWSLPLLHFVLCFVLRFVLLYSRLRKHNNRLGHLLAGADKSRCQVALCAQSTRPCDWCVGGSSACVKCCDASVWWGRW